MQKKAALRVNHLIEERQKSQNATLVGVKRNLFSTGFISRLVQQLQQQSLGSWTPATKQMNTRWKSRLKRKRENLSFRLEPVSLPSLRSVSR